MADNEVRSIKMTCNCSEAFYIPHDGTEKIPTGVGAHNCEYIQSKNLLIAPAIANVASLLGVKRAFVKQHKEFTKRFCREMERLAREKGLV